MTSETDTDIEFLDGLIGRPITVSDRVRLFALARRGAAIENHGQDAKPSEVSSQWRPISEAPKDGTRMLLAYRNTLNKWRRVVAFYAPKFTIEQSAESEWLEYDEALDRYCLPEGWYECIDNWDDYSYVHISGVTPTHWMPLPPHPSGEPSDE